MHHRNSSCSFKPSLRLKAQHRTTQLNLGVAPLVALLTQLTNPPLITAPPTTLSAQPTNHLPSFSSYTLPLPLAAGRGMKRRKSFLPFMLPSPSATTTAVRRTEALFSLCKQWGGGGGMKYWGKERGKPSWLFFLSPGNSSGGKSWRKEACFFPTPTAAIMRRNRRNPAF